MPTKVFIDANIYIADGRPPGKDVIRAIKNLVNSGKIEVVSTDITINEVTRHFTAHDLKSIGNSLKPHVRALVQAVTGVELPDISSEETESRVWERNKAEFDALLKDLSATVLNADSIEPYSVLEDYSRGRGMFNGEAKKDQFPDAFIYKLLEKYSTEAGEILVLTSDSDYAAISSGNDLIKVKATVQDLFDSLNLSIASQDIEHFIARYEEEIHEIAEHEINDFQIYIKGNPELDGYVKSLNALEILELDEFETDEEEILVTGMMRLYATIDYSGMDMTTAFYDSEDKRAYPWQEISGVVDDTFHVRFTMTVLTDERGIPEEIQGMHFINGGPLWVSIEEDLK
ncbi:PIN domain-containing protein [Mesorhizobium silamurunense]|uniref:PIN domain-containing protein n=1 Tax=Mesorhizobium silamurunense TaxID=499528 RepID=UPI00177BB0AC|nr:PIN domain-containing protein [Mesorhizobium silamurunense]